MTAKEQLISTFNKAKQGESKFVFVGIEAEGVVEAIAVPAVSFEAKEKFYLNAYSDELVHVMNSNVRIFGMAYGDESAILELL